MHDIRWIRDNPDAFDKGLADRGQGSMAKALIALDDERRGLIARSETAKARRNALAKEIGQAMAAKDAARAEALKAEVASLKDDPAAVEAGETKATLDQALAAIPNIPLGVVPVGLDEHANVERHSNGGRRNYAFAPKQHFEIGEALGGLDFETAAKLSGSRFVVVKGQVARLERALGQFMIDLHTGEHGYTEVNPPLLVKDSAMFGTAQLPKFEDDQFAAIDGQTLAEIRLTLDDAQDLQPDSSIVVTNIARSTAQWLSKARHWLIPTAEVPLTNLVRESILTEDELPLRYTALTPCFRAEAGAAGRDTRGLIRQHQFTKCELVSITTPDASTAEHERMLSCAEAVLTRLGLHHRTMILCTGDMGFASQKSYDIEVWLPGQNAYREISSCSVCGDFQARRMEARYRPKGEKGTRLVHTLNGSGVAVGRALVAVMETYQNEDGSVTVPDALLPYMGGITRIERPPARS